MLEMFIFKDFQGLCFSIEVNLNINQEGTLSLRCQRLSVSQSGLTTAPGEWKTEISINEVLRFLIILLGRE